MKTLTLLLLAAMSTSAMALSLGDVQRDKLMHFNGAYGIQQQLELEGYTYAESILGCTAFSVLKEVHDEIDYNHPDPKDFAADMLGCFASQLSTEDFRVVARSTTQEKHLEGLGTKQIETHYVGLQWDVDFPWGSKQFR